MKYFFLKGGRVSEDGPFQIFVVTPAGKKLAINGVKPGTTLEELKKMVETQRGHIIRELVTFRFFIC